MVVMNGKNMVDEELITKISQVLKKTDGTEVRITALAMTGSGLAQSTDVYVHVRDNPKQAWRLCSKDAHPDWRTMSAQDYVRNGRSEMLKVVTPGQILKVVSFIGRPLASLEQATEQEQEEPALSPSM